MDGGSKLFFHCPEFYVYEGLHLFSSATNTQRERTAIDGTGDSKFFFHYHEFYVYEGLYIGHALLYSI